MIRKRYERLASVSRESSLGTPDLTPDGVQTSRQSFAKALGRRAKARIVVESSTESEWVAQSLEELGHEVIVADPNFAPMYAQRSKKIKTNRRDARALCEACRVGAYRPAHRTSEASRALRRQVGIRQALVHTRTRYIRLMRAMLRAQGYRIRSGGSRSFREHVLELELPKSLQAELEPLVLMLESLNAQIKVEDHLLEEHAKTNEVAKRLCTAAGVGIALRRGKRIAAVALARKLAGILFAMWRDGTDFGRPKGQAAQAA